jgi:hypothetical protein
MSDIAGRDTGYQHGTALAVVKESYSFACMRCGDGWEQSYEIEHHFDIDGQEFVTYVADGKVVPSPLSHPVCRNCGSNVVRIMRPGRVSSAQSMMHRPTRREQRAAEAAMYETGSTGVPAVGDATERAPGHRHWWQADLLRPFHHRAG